MKSLKGKLLIATPGLVDPNFARSVVLIAEHTPEGAFGLVINRPAQLKVNELWASLSNEPCQCKACTFVGGPVQENHVHILHAFSELAAGSGDVVDGIYLGAELELLEAILQRSESSHTSESAPFRLYCGYAGWGGGQLDREMEAGGWLTLPATKDYVFAATPNDMWRDALSDVGGPYKFFSLMPPNPEHN